MPAMSHWFGGRNLKTGSKISAVITLVALCVDLVIIIYSIVRLYGLKQDLSNNMQRSYLPPGLLPLGYIKLVFTVFGIIFSGFLLMWTSKGYHWIFAMKLWAGVIVATRALEAIFGIYFLAWIGSDNLGIIVVVSPELVAFSAYWIAASLVMMLCIITVISYCQQLEEEYRRLMKESGSEPIIRSYGNSAQVTAKTQQARVIATQGKAPDQNPPKKPRRYLKKGETRDTSFESGV